MRFRRLHIRLQTSDGSYGTTLDFPDGLVVVWADNSMGKSSCVKSMLVALGMEATLTVSQTDLPLTPALTNRLEGENGEILVQESDLFLEIENASGQRVVVRRTVRGTRDSHLVTVTNGPALTQPDGQYQSTDFFVSRPGSATREHGFHRFLAEFCGWELPQVPSYDGKDIPLYLQCVIPYFVVEQTRGWSSTQPPLPTHFRIREPSKRAVEFLLRLDAHRMALRRQELLLEQQSIESAWRENRAAVQVVAKRISGEVQNLPLRPVGDWPPAVAPGIVVAENQRWVPCTHLVTQLRSRHGDLMNETIPQAREITSAISQELRSSETELQRRELILNRMIADLEFERAEEQLMTRRLQAVAEDIQKNQDIETLQNLGSTSVSLLKTGDCPYCHQPVSDSLLPTEEPVKVMSIRENIDFLKEQQNAIRLVHENTIRVVSGRERQVQAVTEDIDRLREKIRGLRETLVADGRLPSLAAIRERIQLEGRLALIEEALDQLSQYMEVFGELAGRWRSNMTEFGKLPSDDVTTSDRGKLATWTDLFRDQLRTYGFRSLPIAQIVISEDSYRPEHDGFEIQADLSEARAQDRTGVDLQTSISASDLIRTIWAYLFGMLELARQVPTNHPGTLVFDEPRQQSTKTVSFAAFLARASKVSQFKQQTILFTSEDRGKLADSLSGLDHTFVEFEGRVIRKVQ